MSGTVFERCGGFVTVRKVVSAFYDKVLDSERLQGYFEDSDMRSLIDHQTKFIASMMGGPASFNDDTLRKVHAGLGISREEFQEVAMLLVETLEDFGVDRDDVAAVEREVLRRESCIVTH